MKQMLMGRVAHEVKVTRMPGHGFGIRVLVNGKVNQEIKVDTRDRIGPAARSMLRMEDKCGNISDFASNARHRVGRKENKRKMAE